MTSTSAPRRVPFGWVDVFTDQPLAGNPLPVVFDADRLSVTTMRSIAREFNQSETTFLVRPTLDAADWQLRSFTPSGDEVLGAGHNAMGAWIWLAGSGRLDPDRDAFVQQIGDDLLDVTVTARGDGRASVSLTQAAPTFLGAVDSDTGDHGNTLANVLGISAARMTSRAEVASTGVAHLLVPVADPDAVDAATPDSARLRAFLAGARAEGCYVYALIPNEKHRQAYARFFNPTVGIVEDPATGTAAGPLAAVLVRDGMARPGEPIRIEQGTKIGRQSVITIHVDDNRVRISGQGVITAEGALTL